MFLLSACLLLGCLILPSHCYQLKNTLCQGSSCYYLYEFIGNYLTWDQSYEACRSEGLEMLRIDSNQTQTLVQRLLQDLPQNTQRKVWIGGRRSNDNTWRFMNGTVFNKQVMEVTSQTEQYCLYVRFCKGINPEYYADNCDEKISASRLLCQYDPSKTGRYRSSDVLCGNKCYMKTQYNGGEPYRIDWYNGQTYCSQSDIHGDIAYSYLDDDTLINNIIDLVHPGAYCAELWLGVRRRIWFWKTAASTKDQDNQPIGYYNWDDQITETSTQDQCIYIDVDQRNKWQIGLSCGLYLRYFTCMKDITTQTTRSTTIMTSTTSTEPRTVKRKETRASETEISKTTSTLTSAMKPTGNKAENILPNVAKPKSSYKTGFFTLIFVSVMLFTVVIIQNVYWMWLRRRKLQKPAPEVKDNNTHPETDNREESEYEMTGEQNIHVDSTVSPEYTEMSTDNNQYERPTVYVNMVDRRNEYESLNG